MDWYVAEGVSTEDAAHLTELEAIRRDDPVYWALVQGLHTSESIAKLILWPHHWVLGTLRRMKEDGLVWESEGKASIIWDLTETDALQVWVARQKQPAGLFRRTDRNDE
jgi:hypothetical protein